MSTSSITLKDPGSSPVNSITDGSTASLPSSCSVNPAPKSLVNENSVVSSGWVSLIILIEPFGSSLKVHTVSRPTRTSTSVIRFRARLSVPVDSSIQSGSIEQLISVNEKPGGITVSVMT